MIERDRKNDERRQKRGSETEIFSMASHRIGRQFKTVFHHEVPTRNLQYDLGFD